VTATTRTNGMVGRQGQTVFHQGQGVLVQNYSTGEKWVPATALVQDLSLTLSSPEMASSGGDMQTSYRLEEQNHQIGSLLRIRDQTFKVLT